MSTAGQAIGGALGAVGGFMMGGFTGAMYGAQLGLMAGGYLDPPKGPHTEGPRLDDVTVQTATYGAVIPRIYGTVALTGNIFWLENNQLKETTTTTQSTSGGKGGGSKTTATTYSYSATFAVGLCAGPIVGVRRIWIAGRLIYDAAATDVAAIIVSNQAAQAFTLHTGAADQAPDARLQATLGGADTPAYRGLAYLVFEDFALADYGNSLLGAQVKAEVVAAASSTPFSQIARYAKYNAFSGGAVRAPAFMRRGALLYFVMPINDTRSGDGYVNISAWDASTGAVTPISFNLSVAGAMWGAAFGKNEDGTLIFGTRDYSPGVVVNGTVVSDTSQSSTGSFYSIRDGRYYTPRSDGKLLEYLIGTSLSPVRRYVPPFRLSTGDSIPWGCDTTADYVYFGSYNVDAAQRVVMKFDRSTGEFVASAALTANGFSVVADDEIYYVVTTGVNTLYVTRDFFATAQVLGTHADLQVGSVGNYRLTVFGIAEGVIAVSTERYSDAIIGVYRYSALLTPQTQPLSAIVSAECLRAGLLTAADLDVSLLTQSVRGYRIGSLGALRAALEPLRSAWPFDVVQHGYKIVFKPRGGASVATIPAADLDARTAGAAPGVSVSCTREMDSQLPRRVRVVFLDLDREYESNEQSEERQNTASVNVTSVDLPVVLSCAEAAGLAQVLLYLYWMERYDVKFTLPPSYAALEPGDVVTVDADEASYTLRLTAITYTADGRLECAAKFANAAIYTPTAQGAVGSAPPQVLQLSGDTRALLLDLPLLLDNTDRPGFVAALCGYYPSWPGGVLNRSDDGGQTWSALLGVAAPGATLCTATNVIGAARTDLIDTKSVLNVILHRGELSSVSGAALFNGANHFAYGSIEYGWEIIGAKTCTLQADGSYNLSDLLRGRAGTEWLCNIHMSGNMLIRLAADELDFVAMSQDSIGAERLYRAATVGQDLAEAIDIAFTYTGVNLMPLSPCYLNGSIHPTTHDWTLAWTRRTRVGGAWRDLVDAPVSEATEAYEVEIYSSNLYTTVKRTLINLSAPSATYTGAQQDTDFSAVQTTLYVKIYQISASVGRGYPLTTRITRSL